MDSRTDIIGWVIQYCRSHGLDYYTTDYGVFIRGDSIRIVREMPRNSISMVFTDPPYGVTKDVYDNLLIFKRILPYIYNVMENNSWLVIYWSVKNLDKFFKCMFETKFEYYYQLIGLMQGSGALSVFGQRRYIPIFIFRKGTPNIMYRRHDVLICDELPNIRIKIGDPLFKPTYTNALILSMLYSHGTLLDPFAGLGSIPLSCEYLGIPWIAIEIQKQKYEKAIELISLFKENKLFNTSRQNNERKENKATITNWIGKNN